MNINASDESNKPSTIESANELMNSSSEYTPPKVWQPVEGNGGKFANTNKPTAGARQQQTLPKGDKPLQLYSLNTPNGVKINILLEELAKLGVKGSEYDAFLINIMEGDQFGSDFVEINPNSKIPALVDYTNREEPVSIFESGAIMMYLAEKFERFIPLATDNPNERATCLSWIMWQMGSAPYVGGGFGHFYNYAPYPMQYPIDRFTMETKRQLDVLDKHLAKNEYMLGEGEGCYSIADMIIWPWYGRLALDELYDNAGTFLDVQSYPHLQRWAKQVGGRPAVKSAVELELRPITNVISG